MAQNIRTIKSTTSLAVLASLMMTSTSVFAQESDAAEEDDSVIIVTAKQREQNLQEVPLPITVFSSDDLETRNILDSRDLALFTPNFNFASGSGRTDPTAVSVRGVAPNTSDERFQGVNFFVDGVPLSGQLSGIDITQLERVEIIKGPQSAQFGRATYSGAVNYITKNPTVDRLEGQVRLRLGQTDNADEQNHYVGASVSFPIVQDKLWGSVNFNQRLEGSLAPNVSVPTTPTGREETFSWGAVLYAEPTPNWTVKFRASRDVENDSVSASHLIHPREFTGTINPITVSPGQVTLLPELLPEPTIGLRGGNPTPSNGTQNPVEGGNDASRLLLSFITDYRFGNDYRLEYKGAYYRQRRDQSLSFRDRDTLDAANGTTRDPIFAGPAANGEVTFGVGFQQFEFQEKFENTSHQLMLLSPAEDAFTWQIGGYYFKEKSVNSRRGNAFGGITPTNPTAQQRGDETIENYAIFGSVAYDLTDQLNVSFEGRYQEEEVELQACTFCATPTPVDFVEKEKDFLPRVTIDYQLTDDNLLYALYSRGVKSGRITRVFANGAPNFAYATPEELDNFEIGSKNVIFGGRGRFNIAAFYSEVKDQQLVSTSFVTDQNGVETQVTAANNVGRSEVLGFEVEFFMDVTDRFTLSGGFGYADQEFKGTTPISGLSTNFRSTVPAANVVTRSAAGAPLTINLDGLTQANVPTTTANFSAQYIQPISDDVDLILRADTTYRGRFFADIGNNTQARASWRTNLRATVDMEIADISFYARNVFNERHITSVGLGGSLSTCAFTETNTATFGSRQRCFGAGIQRPRELGIEITSSF